jgi:hypothetical protein
MNFHGFEPNIGDLVMSTSTPTPPAAPKGQTIEDVVSGGKISQLSETASDLQTVRRAQAPGDITQTKRETAGMKFMGGSARGWGIVGLVIVILAWIAYKYLSSGYQS